LTAFHKIAKRRFDDIPSVAVAFALELQDGVVRDIKIGLGGVAATPLRAVDTEAALNGGGWTREAASAAAEVLGATGTPINDHRASAAYRAAMLRSSLLKFFAENPAPVYSEV
jgi:xanthine dehydrogenase small subunit